MTTALPLPGNAQIPTIGLGTWQSARGVVGEAVKVALEAGYRHIDCAWVYRNENEIGIAIQNSGIARKDIFLTSKLWNSFHRPEHVELCLDETLRALKTDYMDLYLMHWPLAFGVPDSKPRSFPKGGNGKALIDEELTANFVKTWHAMEELVHKGKAKYIGISNLGRCKQLLKEARIKPAVHQIEVNWTFPQHDLVSWCQNQGVIVEAYSPLGSSDFVKDTLDNPTLQSVARELNTTPAQVIIGWLLQRRLVVLVKSVTRSRIISNLDPCQIPEPVFQRLQEESRRLKALRAVDPSEFWGLRRSIFEEPERISGKL